MAFVRMEQLENVASSLPFSRDDTYVYSIVRTDRALAAISSDDTLRLFDRHDLSAVSADEPSKAHDGVTCLQKFDVPGNVLATAGRDGLVRCWDQRSAQLVLEFRRGP